MEPNETVEPTYYNSLYKHGVDEKRRVQVPAKWRPAKPNVEFTLIVWPKSKEGPCLRALPPQEMAELMRDIDAMPNSDPNKVVRVDCKLTGVSAKSVSGRVLTASAMNAHNTFDAPQAVKPAPFSTVSR